MCHVAQQTNFYATIMSTVALIYNTDRDGEYLDVVMITSQRRTFQVCTEWLITQFSLERVNRCCRSRLGPCVATGVRALSMSVSFIRCCCTSRALGLHLPLARHLACIRLRHTQNGNHYHSAISSTNFIYSRNLARQGIIQYHSLVSSIIVCTPADVCPYAAVWP